jgi:hypothetical protein
MRVTEDSRQERLSPPEPGLRLAARSGLDVMLTDAVLDDGGLGRFLKPRAAGRTIAGLARHPGRTARDAGRFGVELARVARGGRRLGRQRAIGALASGRGRRTGCYGG